MNARGGLFLIVLMAGPALAVEAPVWTAVAVEVDGRQVAVGSAVPMDPDLRVQRFGAAVSEADADWTYGEAVVRRRGPSGDEAEWRVAAGRLRLTAVLAEASAIWVAGYASRHFVDDDLAAVPGPRWHESSWRQRGLRLSIPPEHRDEPRVDRRLDQRGVPVVLRLSRDLDRVEAAVSLEGWESAWYVPAQLRETWRQPVLLASLADGDVAVVHDGGLNRLPDGDDQPGFADYCLAVDHVSRLTGDLSQRRWRREITGPAIDAEAISATISQGIHFRGTPAASWPHPVLGNPRSTAVATSADGTGLWVVGAASSRTVAEPWWSPFVWHFAADGEKTLGPYSPSPTAGDGRLRGQVADSKVTGLAVNADGGLVLAVTSDGGNTITRRHPTHWDREVSGWQGQTEPFRGRTLLWGGVVSLTSDHDLRWGRHVGGAGLDRQGRRTQLPCWPEQIMVQDDGTVIAAGRVAAGAQVGPLRAEASGAFLLHLDAAAGILNAHVLPATQIQAIAQDDQGRVIAVGRQGQEAWWAVVDLAAEEPDQTP